MFDAHDALFRETLSWVEFRRKHCHTRGIADRLRRPGKGKEDARLLLTRLNMGSDYFGRLRQQVEQRRGGMRAIPVIKFSIRLSGEASDVSRKIRFLKRHHTLSYRFSVWEAASTAR